MGTEGGRRRRSGNEPAESETTKDAASLSKQAEKVQEAFAGFQRDVAALRGAKQPEGLDAVGILTAARTRLRADLDMLASLADREQASGRPALKEDPYQGILTIELLDHVEGDLTLVIERLSGVLDQWEVPGQELSPPQPEGLHPIDAGRVEQLAGLLQTSSEQATADSIATTLSLRREVESGGKVLVRRSDGSVWEVRFK